MTSAAATSVAYVRSTLKGGRDGAAEVRRPRWLGRLAGRGTPVLVVGALGVTAAALPVSAPAASAGQVGELRVAITGAPRVFDYRRTVEMAYRLTFATGDREERFRVAVNPPRFDDGGSPFLAPEGLQLALEGPARAGIQRTGFARVACSSYNVSHGADPTNFSLDVAAPANTTSTLTARFGVSRRDAPFPDLDVRPTFRIDGQLVAPQLDGPATLPGALVLRPSRPQILAPSGVHITMRTRPRTRRFLARKLPTYRPGRLVRIFGRTDPILRRQVIELRVLRAGFAKPRPLARVLTDARGRFKFRWRPRRLGVHQLFAFYRRQQRGVTSDRACPQVLRIARGRDRSD